MKLTIYLFGLSALTAVFCCSSPKLSRWSSCAWYSKAASAKEQHDLVGRHWAYPTRFFHNDVTPGPVFKSMKDIEEGVAAFTRVVRLWKEGKVVSQAWLYVGELYTLIEAWPKVIESMDEMRSISRASPYHLVGAAKLISKALTAMGDTDGALSYNRAVLRWPELPDTFKFSTYNRIARIHGSRGDLAEAIRTLEELKVFIRTLGLIDGYGRYSFPDGTGKQVWEYVAACKEISRLQQSVQEADI